MSFISTRFRESWAVLEELRWLFWVISFMSKNLDSEKKNWINISCRYAHQHGLFFTTTKFKEILFGGFRGVALIIGFSSIFHFGQISKFKKGVTPRKKIESKLPMDMLIYTVCPSTKFHEILLSGFRGVALTRKTGLTDWLTDWLTYWLTDWLTDETKSIFPPQLRAWGKIMT